ncbi:MAG: SDR family NAD(P)-dependent oxidoreductase [Bacteriovorax sp.]|nr:SDR family NAD(P)-dependent oxidoreductase [Bacteriovorax sp.]
MDLTTSSDRPLAVVTGASSGIGYELAKQFAQHGFDLVIVSDNPAIVEAAQICETLGANVESFIIDLADYEGVDELIEKISATGRPVEAIAINAGVGLGGNFAKETNLEDELYLIHLNVISSVHLAKHIVKDMVNRKKGRILFTSSIAEVMPTPLQAVYGASEAFIQSFSEAIRNELKETGVTVTTLMPGPTDTNFTQGPGLENSKAAVSKKDSPALVALQGFEAMMAGKGHVVTGSFMNKVEVVLSKFKTEESKADTLRKDGEPARLKH